MFQVIQIFLFCAAIAIALFYFFFLSIRPFLYFRGVTISRFLEKCSFPTSAFSPNPVLAFFRTGVFQTLASAAIAVQPPPTDREVILTSSGGIALDWVLPSYPDLSATGVLVILSHGLLGRGCVNAMHDLAIRARSAGSLVVLVQPPGVAGTEGVAGVGFKLSAELQAVSEKISERVGSHVPKILIAFSIASIPALSFLPNSSFAAAALICAPIEDLSKILMKRNVATDEFVSAGKIFLRNNGEFATRKWADLIQPALKSETVADFAREFSDKALGRSELAPINDADVLQMPTLFLYALDDPWISFDSVDLLRLIRNENVAVAVTEQGGHCGFLAGFGSRRWVNTAILEFVEAAIRPVI